MEVPDAQFQRKNLRSTICLPWSSNPMVIALLESDRIRQKKLRAKVPRLCRTDSSRPQPIELVPGNQPNLVATIVQSLADTPTDESGGAGYKDPHFTLLPRGRHMDFDRRVPKPCYEFRNHRYPDDVIPRLVRRPEQTPERVAVAGTDVTGIVAKP